MPIRIALMAFFLAAFAHQDFNLALLCSFFFFWGVYFWYQSSSVYVETFVCDEVANGAIVAFLANIPFWVTYGILKINSIHNFLHYFAEASFPRH